MCGPPVLSSALSEFVVVLLFLSLLLLLTPPPSGRYSFLQFPTFGKHTWLQFIHLLLIIFIWAYLRWRLGDVLHWIVVLVTVSVAPALFVIPESLIVLC